MKAIIHGFPMPFITVDGHYKLGTIFNWNDETKYVVHKCDKIGENPKNQLQNVYVKPVDENEPIEFFD